MDETKSQSPYNCPLLTYKPWADYILLLKTAVIEARAARVESETVAITQKLMIMHRQNTFIQIFAQ